jgi:hypothetical protein
VGGCVSCNQLDLFGICTALTGQVGDCTGGQLCGADGLCTGVDGGPCSTDADCPVTGFCEDGVCCNERCQDNCESCLTADTGLPDGLCAGTTGAQPECSGVECIGKGQCCGDPIAAPGGSCPAECTGGCNGSVCAILCDGNEECQGVNIVCPAGFDCSVLCSGYHGCRDSALDCPPDHDCEVICTGPHHACERLQITCSNGPCALDCQGGESHCKDTTVECGTNSCQATCDGVAATLNCNASCSCTGC